MATSDNLPIVSLSADTEKIVEGKQPQTLFFALSKPAPAEGLRVNLLIKDPDDGEREDTIFPPETITNITDFGQVIEEEQIFASLTIAPGKREATFGIAAIDDGVAEENETFSLSLLEDDNYAVDSAENIVTTTIIDATNRTSTVSIYNLEWTGEANYRAEGFFSFDSELEGLPISEDELNDLQLAFYNPSDELIQVFDYDFPNPDSSGEFNFNFDSATGTVLQSGESDSDKGFDLGIDFIAEESGIGFFSGEDDFFPRVPPGGTIGLTSENPPFFELLDQGGELIATPRLTTYELSWEGEGGYNL